MSRTKSKLHVTLVLSTAFLLAFLGWKPESAAAKDQVTLQWLEWWDGEWGTATMDALMKRFEDKTGIKVERTAVPWDSMYDLMIADAQGGGKYDVYGMEGCCFLTGIDKLGGLEPLGPYLRARQGLRRQFNGHDSREMARRTDDAELVYHALFLRL